MCDDPLICELEIRCEHWPLKAFLCHHKISKSNAFFRAKKKLIKTTTHNLLLNCQCYQLWLLMGIFVISTVQKFQDFSVTQILCESNHGMSCKIANFFSSFEGMNLVFVFFLHLSLQKVQKFLGMKIQSL